MYMYLYTVIVHVCDLPGLLLGHSVSLSQSGRQVVLR